MDSITTPHLVHRLRAQSDDVNHHHPTSIDGYHTIRAKGISGHHPGNHLHDTNQSITHTYHCMRPILLLSYKLDSMSQGRN